MSVKDAKRQILYEKLLMKDLIEKNFNNETELTKIKNKIRNFEENFETAKALERILEEDIKITKTRLDNLKIDLGIKP